MDTKLLACVRKVSEKFVYTKDKVSSFTDYWFVMEEKDGKLRGDCDDFSVTCIWEYCDRDLWTFVKNVLILHKCRMYFCETKTGGKHAVGNIGEFWFDNWTKTPMTKDKFVEQTGHKIVHIFPGPLIAYFLLFGLTKRNK